MLATSHATAVHLVVQIWMCFRMMHCKTLCRGQPRCSAVTRHNLSGPAMTTTDPESGCWECTISLPCIAFDVEMRPAGLVAAAVGRIPRLSDLGGGRASASCDWCGVGQGSAWRGGQGWACTLAVLGGGIASTAHGWCGMGQGLG